jgi:capsular exopolysaccharide synthesis family protein
VANFGVVAAQAGSRVCLVDSDLRRPALHRIFGLQNHEGLTTALVEAWPFAKVARPTRIPNLSVVTSGRLPPNPAELISSKRMGELLEAAGSDFDLVICDSPPVIPIADALALAAHCDGVILVIRVGTIPPNVIRRAAEQIEAVKGRILGVLLNYVDFSRDYGDYHHYYQAYYDRKEKR